MPYSVMPTFTYKAPAHRGKVVVACAIKTEASPWRRNRKHGNGGNGGCTRTGHEVVKYLRLDEQVSSSVTFLPGKRLTSAQPLHNAHTDSLHGLEISTYGLPFSTIPGN